MKKFSDGKYLFLLVIPTIICLALFYYLPMYGLIISFMEYKPFLGFAGSKWVGFKHFIDFFNFPNFKRLIVNTTVISFYSLIFGFPLPIIFALVLNEVKNARFKKFVQTVSYMPHFYSTVVVIGLFSMFLDPVSGLITHFFNAIGIDKIDWLSDQKCFRAIYIISELWQQTGWGAIVYLAALTNVDPQLYEAAYVDGAGKMRCVWSITLPSIAPTMITMLLLRMGSLFNVGFERAFLLQKPENAPTSEIISTYVYEKGIRGGSQSSASAIGLFNSLISLVMLIVSNYVANKVSDTSLW